MAENRKCLQHNSVGVRIMQDTKRVKNPGKQRKRLFNAPAHIRHKLMSAPLSHELSASRGAKTLPVRRGDTILIKRGDNKGFEGKVSRVDLKAYRIYIEGLTREKVDGTNIFIPIHPSKVEIRNLNLDDKWRKAILDRKKEIAKPAKAEKPTVKPAKKVEKAPAKVEEVKEEKPVKVTPVEEKVAPEVAKEQAPDMTTEEAPAPKKAVAKKSAAKKPAAKKAEPAKKQEAPAPVKKEKAPVAKKAVKPTAAAKKAPAAKKTEEKEAAPKPRAKSKISEKTQGGQ
jgi:large subunit ribosomal protein L24